MKTTNVGIIEIGSCGSCNKRTMSRLSVIVEVMIVVVVAVSAAVSGSTLRLRAHRDELIAIELELSESLELSSDGSLLSSPI